MSLTPSNLPPLPPAILLDLDDTILAYSAAIEPSIRTVTAHFAPRLGNLDPEQLYQVVCAEAEWFWGDAERHRRGRLDMVAAREEIFTATLRRFGLCPPGLAREMAVMRTELHEQAIQPFPDAIETVRRLRDTGVRLALITNGAADIQSRKIARFELRPLFDCIVIEGKFGCGKPEPAVFHHALTALGVTPQAAWMVGDNLSLDIAAAQAVGIFAVWNDHRGLGLPADASIIPDRIIRHLQELLPAARV